MAHNCGRTCRIEEDYCGLIRFSFEVLLALAGMAVKMDRLPQLINGLDCEEGMEIDHELRVFLTLLDCESLIPKPRRDSRDLELALTRRVLVFKRRDLFRVRVRRSSPIGLRNSNSND